MDRPPCVLTIAGSDSGGGAGIQADLKAITMLGGFGASVITALTAQNTAAVTGIHAPSAKFVALQLQTVLEDITVDAAKTGMLFSASIIGAIAPILEKREFPLVVDPVCVSTSGAKLLKDDAVQAMVDLMFPLAEVLTPNVPEAELLTGLSIQSRDDIFKAADVLLGMGPKAVLMKGGHFETVAMTDWFCAKGAEPIPLMQPRVDTECTHGTGCTLSASIATGLAQGMDVIKAVTRAQEYLNLALRSGYRLGNGGGLPNHLAPWLKERARRDVLENVDVLGRSLQFGDAASVFSRTRTNVAVALPWAGSMDDVAAFTGGVFTTGTGELSIAGYPQFGASARTASALLTALRFRPEVGCAVSFRLTAAVKRALGASDLGVVDLSRKEMPEYVNREKGGVEKWGVYEMLKAHASPDAVDGLCDPGGLGAEPMGYLWAEDIVRLLDMLEKLGSLLDS